MEQLISVYNEFYNYILMYGVRVINIFTIKTVDTEAKVCHYKGDFTSITNYKNYPHNYWQSVDNLV